MKSSKRKDINSKRRTNRKKQNKIKKKVGRKKAKQLDSAFTNRNPHKSKNVRIQKPKKHHKKRSKKRSVISPQGAFNYRIAELSIHNFIVIVILLMSFFFFLTLSSTKDSTLNIQFIIALHLTLGVGGAYLSMRLREEALVKKYPIICTRCKIELDLLSKERVSSYRVSIYHSVYHCSQCGTEYFCRTRERI